MKKLLLSVMALVAFSLSTYAQDTKTTVKTKTSKKVEKVEGAKAETKKEVKKVIEEKK